MDKETKNKKNLIKNLIGGGIIIIILIIIFFPYSSFTVYIVQCNNAATDFSSCVHPEALARETFNADVSKNQVIETSPDTTDVDKLNYCTIEDGQHWSCGGANADWSIPGGILAATQISRSGNNFEEYGVTNLVIVTESQWSSINNGAPSTVCGTTWCDQTATSND